MVAVLVSTVAVGPAFAGPTKVTVCHKLGTEDQATLEIASAAQAAHLAHGDYAGECRGPQSSGCDGLNALVPDPFTGTDYFYAVSDLGFFAGETISLQFSLENASDPEFYANDVAVGVRSTTGWLAFDNPNLPFSAKQVTSAVDYAVQAGDDADGVRYSFLNAGNLPANLTELSISCTPDP